jgi:hypothetical protein
MARLGRRRRSAWCFVVLGALGAGACAEGSRSESDPGTLIPIDGGRRKDAGPDASHVGDDADVGPDLDAGDPRRDADAGETVNDADANGPPAPPIADGTISPGEYGVHSNGHNMQTSDVDAASPSAWYMTWDASNVYVAISFADVTEGVVLYFDSNPIAGSPSGGSDADGSLVGYTYDGSGLSPLPFRADFVAYVKDTYNEVRIADGAGQWGAPVTSALTQVGGGNTREIVIPWTSIRPAGRPTAFSWLGYATSASGYVYAEMPPDNPSGSLGPSAEFPHFYAITDATPATGTPPFASDLSP